MPILLSLLAAPVAVETQQSDAPSKAEVVQDVYDYDEDDFEPAHFAFSMNDNLHPSIDGNTMPFFLGGCLGIFGGQLWLPSLMLGEQPNDWFSEAVLSWAIFAAPSYFWWIFWPLGLPYYLAVHFYLIPVNVINAWDRAAKLNGMKGEGEGKRKRKQKRKKRRSRDDDYDDEASLRALPAAPLAAMAY